MLNHLYVFTQDLCIDVVAVRGTTYKVILSDPRNYYTCNNDGTISMSFNNDYK